jgi:hypothetical protein
MFVNVCVYVCVYVYVCVRERERVERDGLPPRANQFLCHIYPYMSRVGQNHIYTVYIRYIWLGNYQIYGVYIRIYTVLANPIHVH